MQPTLYRFRYVEYSILFIQISTGSNWCGEYLQVHRLVPFRLIFWWVQYHWHHFDQYPYQSWIISRKEDWWFANLPIINLVLRNAKNSINSRVFILLVFICFLLVLLSISSLVWRVSLLFQSYEEPEVRAPNISISNLW